MKKTLFLLAAVFIATTSIARAVSVFNSNQVGQNPVNGYYLQTNGATSTWQPVATSGVVINGVQGPTFTISIVNTSTASSITTSSANLFLNLLRYTSGTNINVASDGTINFVNPGYISSAITSINGATSSAQIITAGAGINVSTGNPTTTITNTGVTAITTSSPIQASVNTGNITISCPTCLTANQSISLTGPVTGSGTTSIATTITSPMTVNVSSSQVTSTNSNFTTSTIQHLVLNVTSTFLAADAVGNVIATTTPAGGGGLATSTLFIQKIEYANVNENSAVFNAVTATTVTSCTAVEKSTGDTFTWGLGYNASRATATSSLTYLVNTTTTVATTSFQTMTLATTTIPAGVSVIFYTTAASTTEAFVQCNGKQS